MYTYVHIIITHVQYAHIYNMILVLSIVNSYRLLFLCFFLLYLHKIINLKVMLAHGVGLRHVGGGLLGGGCGHQGGGEGGGVRGEL